MDSMRIFYTGSDIEDLAANGIRQLEISPEVTLTDAARERAEELGVSLVTPADASARKIVEQIIPAKVETLPSRPRGCQHGPLTRSISQSGAVGGQGPMVDQLVEAVSALTKRGG
jgi:hypothetical protein